VVAECSHDIMQPSVQMSPSVSGVESRFGHHTSHDTVLCFIFFRFMMSGTEIFSY